MVSDEWVEEGTLVQLPVDDEREVGWWSGSDLENELDNIETGGLYSPP